MMLDIKCEKCSKKESVDLEEYMWMEIDWWY